MDTFFHDISGPITVWVRGVGEHSEKTIHKFVDLLTKQDIEVQDYRTPCSHSGIVFSNKVTPELCEQLCELSHNGQIQVLACCHEAISGEAIWQLMEAGASDVLVCTKDNLIIHEITARLRRWEAINRLLNSSLV